MISHITRTHSYMRRPKSFADAVSSFFLRQRHARSLHTARLAERDGYFAAPSLLNASK